MTSTSTTLTQSPLVMAILSSHGLVGASGQLDLELIQQTQEEEAEEVFEEEKDVTECQWSSCSLKFPNRPELAHHVNKDHLGKAHSSGFKCLWKGCTRLGKTFNAKYKMLIHIRTHTNEKPHNCSSCGKSFTRIENLKIHFRTHTGEKPYLCPMKDCGKAYSNSSDRFKHIRTHYHERPYKCRKEGCVKRYTDPSSLRKHMKNCSYPSPPATIKADLQPLDLSK